MKLWVFVLFFSVMAGFSYAEGQAEGWTFEPLPYSYDALEPFIDAETMEIHYSRHHKSYYSNLIKAAEETGISGKPLDQILSNISAYPAAVRNNGGQHYNHSMFWKVISPSGGGSPKGELSEKINSAFGSFEKFKGEFNKAALSRFGSGWAWLCLAKDGTLFITSTPNEENPLMDIAADRGIPILVIDVWEHSYYLKYKNMRGSYIDNFWNVVNWTEAGSLYKAAVQADRRESGK